MGEHMKRVIEVGLKSLGFCISFLTWVALQPGVAEQEYILLKNAKIYTMGSRGILEPGMLLIKGEKIEKIGQNISAPSAAQIIDLSGKTVIPGMISASSSLFLAGKDRAFLGDENPDSDILEGLDYFDDSIPDIVSQGVTTVYISAVSFQTTGGLGAVVKLPAQKLGAVEVLKGKAGLRLKLESLENKKTSSLLRLTQYQRVRDLFIQAQEYRKEWQKYEKRLSEYKESQKGGTGQTKLKEPEKPKRDEGKEIFLQAMEKKIPVRIEAHRPDAILNALRLGEEFSLRIILEKCEDWPKVLPQLKAASVSLLSNPLLNYQKYMLPGGAKGYAACLLNAKEEDFFYAGRELSSEHNARQSAKNWNDLAVAKIPLAVIPPDNYPLSARYLRYYASLLVAQGLPALEALKAATSTPANILGVSDTVGSLEEGKDADLVVLSGEPLNSLSRVEIVIVNGKSIED
jgi:imidazolonepropionase-like amidohydrolase